MRAPLAAALLLLGTAPAARALMPSRQDKRDAGRFAYNQRSAPKPAALAAAERAAWNFNQRSGRMTPSAAGRAFAPGAATAKSLAQQFLQDARTTLGIDPAALSVERETSAPGHKHILYRQTYKGLPVEFAHVKVHFADNGAVVSVDSAYEKSLSLSVVPLLSASAAAAVVRNEPGVSAAAEDAASLVVLPDPQGGPARLAWRLTASASGGRHRFYVDGQDGRVLLRHSELREACGTQGNMSAMIYDVDPITNQQPAVRGLNHLRVYQGDASTYADTDISGNYCGAGIGKIFTQFQGPFVNVSNFRGPSADYNNGNGGWSTVATAVSSPHPYANGADITNTIDLRGRIPPDAVKILPVFSTFKVGIVSNDKSSQAEGGDIVDNSQVQIYDSSMNPVAAYVGDRGSFKGTGVPGQLMYVRLRATPVGTNVGYDIGLSSYLTLGPQAHLDAGVGNSFVWYGTNTYVGLRGEFNLFYHLNLMHDYFMFGQTTGGARLYGNDNAGNPILGVDISSAAYLGKPVNAVAYIGPSITNAFYDPVYDNLVFGDVDNVQLQDLMTDDATIPHHEYTHYVVEKIWSLQNFGEAGAISEGTADYFSASSLNDPNIALYAIQTLSARPLPLRELDGNLVPPAPNPIYNLDTCGPVPADLRSVNTRWSGEIHCDGRFLAQALWDLRKLRIRNQAAAGAAQACADGLAFQSLLFFPESFDEYLRAMQTVDRLGLVPACAVGACGGNAALCAQADINTAFTNHGIQPMGGTSDPYDTINGRNDGFESAVDISTMPLIQATIFPQGDIDFFTFPAPPGPLSITLNLPADPVNRGLYKGYMMTLFDAQHHQIGQAVPTMDGAFSIPPFCEDGDCTTSTPAVTLNYSNPAATQMFLEVSGGPTFAGGSNSGVNSTVPYLLALRVGRSGASQASIVTATFDADVIGFSVKVATWPYRQDFRFSYAQLRDQAQSVIPNTLTHAAHQAGDFLDLVSSTSALGKVSGTLQLRPGFAVRFPSLGTVALEVFGYNVQGSTISLGLSQPFNLSAAQSGLTAWNNVFDPTKGQKATVKYEILQPGHVTLRLYTVSGTYIATLLDNDVPAGKGAVDWGGTNVSGNIVASGVYLLYMHAPGFSKTQKIVVVK